MTRTVLAAVCAALVCVGAQAAYTVTTFTPAGWGASDAALGLDAGAAIESFEDATLMAGLQVRTVAAGGSYGPTGTLPALFDPSLDPNPLRAFYSYPCGVPAACSSLWDGSHSLVNTYTNQAMTYTTGANWGDIELTFAGGAMQVGFSLQQNEAGVAVRVNGALVTTLASAGGARFGYVRIDVTGGSAPIQTLRLSNNASGDGWAIDHLAVTAVPEPAPALIGRRPARGAGGAARRRDSAPGRQRRVRRR